MILHQTPRIGKKCSLLIIRYVQKNEETRERTIKEKFVVFQFLRKKWGGNCKWTIEQTRTPRVEYHWLFWLRKWKCQQYVWKISMSPSTKRKNNSIIYSSFIELGWYTFCIMLYKSHNIYWLVNRLYNLFSASPDRWSIITEKTGCSLHRQCNTRWRLKKEAIRSIARHLHSVIDALDKFIETREDSLTN